MSGSAVDIIVSRGVEWASDGDLSKDFLYAIVYNIPMKSRTKPLEATCRSPIKPQALPIVCLNHNTSSPEPEPVYSDKEASSARREDS